MNTIETINRIPPDEQRMVHTILEQHVRNNETHQIIHTEINAILSHIQGGMDEYERTKTYFAVYESGIIVGIMGYCMPDPDITAHFKLDSATSAEIVNVFVEQNHMGQGIGQKLLFAVTEELKRKGIKTLVVSSGPRYQKSWGFYDKTFDRTGGFIQNKFGPGRHAKTWIKQL